MNNLFSSKHHVMVIALTVVTAIAIGCMSAFMITAAPENTALPTHPTRDGVSRIVSPFAGESSSLSEKKVVCYYDTSSDELSENLSATSKNNSGTDAAQSDDDDYEYTVITAESITASAPEISADEETTSPETKEPADTEEIQFSVTDAVTEAITEAPVAEEITDAVTESQEIEENPADAVVLPDLPDGFLADELLIDYTLKTPMYEVTEQELIYVATVVQLEVMGSGSRLYSFEDIPEKYFEMLSVAQCIRNRMESKRFPNTASGVIFQCGKNGSGKFVYQFYAEDVLSLYEPTYEAYVAAYEVLCSGVTVLPTNYYYFCATRICDYFENTNYAALARRSDGSFDKRTGHLTTFYGGY